MDEILGQLGGLVLGSVPTMVLFVLLVIAYGFLVRGPLAKVLGERESRTSGAMERAREAIAAVEAKTTEYEVRLRKAKADIFAAREQRLKQWNAEREEDLAQARNATAEKIGLAKLDIEQSVAMARQQIEGMSAELSAQIMRAVLPAGIQPGAAQ
jgi:F-type H+-transporting ATPase subunit b